MRFRIGLLVLLPRLSIGDRKLFLAYALLASGPAAASTYGAAWLNDRGVGLGTLGLWVALPLLLRALVSDPLCAWANRQKDPATAIRYLTALSGIAGLGGILAGGAWSAIAIWCIMNLAAHACFPLLDTAILAMGDPQGRSKTLTHAKACGALAYVTANLVIGVLYAHGGGNVVLVWVMASALPVILLARRLMPAAPDDGFLQRAQGATRDTCARPRRFPLWLVLLPTGLIEASHGFHTTALVGWRDRGIDLDLGGLLWGTGAFFDILFLFRGTAFRERVGPWGLLVIGGVAATTRWIGFALHPDVATIFVLQALHALSFTATSLASIELIAMLPAPSRMRAQVTNWALTTGLAKGAMVIISTPLYALYGTAGYWLMVAMALAGAGLAAIGGTLSQHEGHSRRIPANG